MKKLRRGQDITSELINELIDELEELKSQHKQAELDKSDTEEKLSEFDSRMTTWEESYSSALEAIPDLPSVLQMYAEARGGFVNELDNNTPVISSTSAITIGYLTKNETSCKWTDDSGNGNTEEDTTFTGDSGYYWGIITNGETIYHTKEKAQGPQGTMGPAGVQGIKGDTGAVGARGPQGAQGQTGASGRTPRLTFAFADNIQGKNAVTEANANKRFIGIKVYYDGEDTATINSRPYTWYQAQGITYYPQIDDDGYLTFSENIPTSQLGRFKIKGDKGEKGDTGSAPTIALKYTDNNNDSQTIAANVSGTNSRTVDSNLTYTFDLDVLKNTTLRGATGPSGADGAQGPKGDTGEPGYLKGTLQYRDSNDDWATVEGATGILYKNSLPYTEAKEGEAYLIGDTGKVAICIKEQSNGCVFKYIGGVRGPKGDKGDTGSTGPQGEKGATGDTGKAITNIKTRLLANGETEVQLMMSDGTDATFNIPSGPQGLQGERGPQGPAGTSVKIKENQASATDIGDAYIDTQGRICIRIAASGDNQFTTGAQIRGPKGDAVFMRTYTTNNVTYIQYALADESTLIENIPSNKWINIINIDSLKGPQGVAAGFASPEAVYDTSHDSDPDNTRTPAVSVAATGNNTDKKFSFTFSGLKGPKGDTGQQGVIGPSPTLYNIVTIEPDPNNAEPHGTIQPTSTPNEYKLQLFNIQGIQGPKGDTGATGPQGPAGVNGLQGPQGPQGPAGIQGPKGDSGNNGNTWSTGTGNPSGNSTYSGEVGDLYLDTNTCKVYKCGGGINWTEECNIKGEPGAAGATGAQGPKGDKGDKGDKGNTGAQGPKGDTGVANITMLEITSLRGRMSTEFEGFPDGASTGHFCLNSNILETDVFIFICSTLDPYSLFDFIASGFALKNSNSTVQYHMYRRGWTGGHDWEIKCYCTNANTGDFEVTVRHACKIRYVIRLRK